MNLGGWLIVKKSQIMMIKNHLVEFGNITSMEAFNLYGCTRLSSVIFKLRKRGMDIKTVECYGRNRYNNATRYAKYIFEK